MAKEVEKFIVIPARLLEGEIKPHNARYLIDSGEYNLKPEDVPYYTNCSMEQAGENMGLKNFDYALPQRWVDNVVNITGKNPVGHVVWCYDNSKCFGEGIGITREGKLIMEIYQHIVQRG